MGMSKREGSDGESRGAVWDGVRWRMGWGIIREKKKAPTKKELSPTMLICQFPWIFWPRATVWSSVIPSCRRPAFHLAEGVEEVSRSEI